MVVALLGSLAVVAASCTVKSVDLASKACQVSSDCATGQHCMADGACEIPVVDAGDFCNGIPHFTGTQVVDGRDDDLQSIPPVVYPYTVLKNLFESPVPVGIDTTARVGWSSAGLHLYFHEVYEDGGTVRAPNAYDSYLWNGDAFEVFAKSDDHLSGNFSTSKHVDVGALQFVIAADPTSPPRTQVSTSFGADDGGQVPDGGVASLRDSTGYALELFIPWAEISPPPDAGNEVAVPEAGANVAFDFSIDYHSRTEDDMRLYQLSLALKPVPSSAACPMNGAFPSCDDRTWCTPLLLP